MTLAEVASAGVHDPGRMPFFVPWTDQPAPQMKRSSLQYHWQRRAEWQPDRWMLEFAVYRDGAPIGIQGVGAKEFAVRRVVETGSWIGIGFQGQGLGKEMRAAVLALAFAGLGATYAQTEAFEDNPSSIGVTRAMGYRPNGFDVKAPRGEAALLKQFILDRDDWQANRTIDVEITGLDPCLELLGAR